MRRELRSNAGIVLCGMPIVTYCYVWLFWLLASAVLGRWARPGMDDPKGFLFGIPNTLGILLMLLSFSVAPLILYLGLRRKKIARYSLAYSSCLVISIVLFRLDILQITTWIAD